MINLRDDIILAVNARKNAYAPYSKYTVGAVLTTQNGRKYIGANIENIGVQSICAERSAFVRAMSEGERLFEKIVIIGGPEDKDPVRTLPCGYCRQFMSEFVDKDFKIYTVFDKKVEEYTLEELFPNSFNME